MVVFVTLVLAFYAATMALALPDLLDRARRDMVVAGSLALLAILCCGYVVGWLWVKGLL
jgi:hypothetical protein